MKVEGEGEQWKSKSCALCAYRKQGYPLFTFTFHLHLFLMRKDRKMATKTQNIEVKVDERLATEITGKAVERWHATTFSNGKRKVYVTFEEVKTVG